MVLQKFTCSSVHAFALLIEKYSTNSMKSCRKRISFCFLCVCEIFSNTLLFFSFVSFILSPPPPHVFTQRYEDRKEEACSSRLHNATMCCIRIILLCCLDLRISLRLCQRLPPALFVVCSDICVFLYTCMTWLRIKRQLLNSWHTFTLYTEYNTNNMSDGRIAASRCWLHFRFSLCSFLLHCITDAA